MADLREDVILVPPDMRQAFLNQDVQSIRIQSDDLTDWVRPSTDEVATLTRHLTEHINNRFSCPTSGVRVGHDSTGVYIHQDHLKRYYGVLRELASMILKTEVPEAMPKTSHYSDGNAHNSTEMFLGRMLNGLDKISDNVRDEVLRAAFRGVDKDRNGTLSKEEMINLVRRVLPTMSGKQVVDLMKAADQDGSGAVDYEEFVTWLEQSAPDEVKQQLAGSMDTEYDCVSAVFRLWDRNGDGLITKKELKTVLAKTCPEMSTSQVDTLCLHMDRNKDGFIDYSEFLEFLFA